MTAAEAFQLTTGGGTADFEQVIRVCEQSGPYCLIGGLAVNCYVEPVYTLDADLVIAATNLQAAEARLLEGSFAVQWQEHTVNAQAAGSQLRIQFTRDQRYQDFPSRAEYSLVFGIRTRIAALEDVAQGKLWAYADPSRSLSKRKKDELDLIRLAEQYPHLIPRYPQELQDLLKNG